jgi:hypothetical protein
MPGTRANFVPSKSGTIVKEIQFVSQQLIEQKEQFFASFEHKKLVQFFALALFLWRSLDQVGGGPFVQVNLSHSWCK